MIILYLLSIVLRDIIDAVKELIIIIIVDYTKVQSATAHY